MTPSATIRHRVLLPTLALLTASLLAACGDDTSASSSAETPVDGAEAGSTATSGNPLEDAQEALDAVGDDAALDAVGQAVVTVLSSATGYEIDGTTLYVDVDGDPAEALSNCQIVLGAAGAFTDDPDVVLRYDGDEVDCAQF